MELYRHKDKTAIDSVWVLLILIHALCGAGVTYLAVSLRNSQSHIRQELVNWHVDLRSEVSREVQGQAYDDVVGQDLQESTYGEICETAHDCGRSRSYSRNIICLSLTLKLAGSTRSLKACSSLRLLRAPCRSSILPTASLTAPMMVFPWFFTWADPGLRSAQWAK